MMLQASEVNLEQLEGIKIFHFGSLSMTHEPSATATLTACKHAKKNGALISYDPNYRAALWKDEESAIQAIHRGLLLADIVKISHEELELLTGTSDLDKGSLILLDQFDLQVLLVTLGEQGCFIGLRGESALVPGFEVTAIDTTGAGDAFFGGFLYKVLSRNTPLNHFTKVDYLESVQFANAVGALVTTKKGAIPSIPDFAEIEKLLNS